MAVSALRAPPVPVAAAIRSAIVPLLPLLSARAAAAESAPSAPKEAVEALASFIAPCIAPSLPSFINLAIVVYAVTSRPASIARCFCSASCASKRAYSMAMALTLDANSI